MLADPLRRAQLLGPYHALGAAWATTSNRAYLVIELA